MRLERVVLLPLAVLAASCLDPVSDSRSVAADASELTYEVDRSERLVRASLGDAITRVAKRYGDQGCVLHPDDHDGIHFVPVPVETTLPDRDRTPRLEPAARTRSSSRRGRSSSCA